MAPPAVRTLQRLDAETGYRVDTLERDPATAPLTCGEGRSLMVILGPGRQGRAGRCAAQELTACSQMATFRECSRSARRRSTRCGWTACGMFAPGLVSWFGSSGWPAGNPGDARPVGEGVSELRIDHGPGYRVYFKKRGRTIIVLLAGGDKRTQSRDIETALRLARNL